jgi:hypothetical protein
MSDDAPRGLPSGLLDMLQSPTHTLSGQEAEVVSVVAGALPDLVSPAQRQQAAQVLASQRAQSRGRHGAPYRPPSARSHARPQSASPTKRIRVVPTSSTTAFSALALSPRRQTTPRLVPQDTLDFRLAVGATPNLKTRILQAALCDELDQPSSNGVRDKPSKRILKGTGMGVDPRTKQQAHSMVKGLRKEIVTWQQTVDAARIIRMYWAACLAQGSAGRLARARCRQRLHLNGRPLGSKPEFLMTPLKTPASGHTLRSTCEQVRT